MQNKHNPLIFGDRAMIEVTINGIDLFFETTSQAFSPNSIDIGTLAMLSAVEFT